MSLNPPSLLVMDLRRRIQLQRSLSAVFPEEGCALLIGHIFNDKQWVVHWIWPCCNVWQPNENGIISRFDPGSDKAVTGDRYTRFAVDPREQLAAQIWARHQRLWIFGVAHSHPNGEATPSQQDLDWGLVDSLFLIQSKDGHQKAWWLDQNRHASEIFISQDRSSC